MLSDVFSNASCIAKSPGRAMVGRDMAGREQRPNKPPDERWFDQDDEPVPPRKKTSVERKRDAEELARKIKEARWNHPYVFSAILLCVLLSLLFVLAFMRDEPLPWEADLKWPTPLQTEPPISAPLRMKTLLFSAQTLKADTLRSKPFWQWDTPALSKLMDERCMVLDNLRDLLEDKEDEWQPHHVMWMKEDLGDHPAWPSVILMKQAEVAYLHRRGLEESAFRAAADMAVLAGLMERINAWPSLMDRALELHESSALSLAELLRNTQLSEDKLRQLQVEEYQPWIASIENLSQSMRGFYAYERKLLLGPDVGEPPLPPGYVPARSGWLLFKPNATLRLFTDSFRELKDETLLPPLSRSNQFASRLLSSANAFSNPNSSGEDYYSRRFRPYADLPDQVYLARTRHAMVVTLFALRRYVMKEFRVPQKLEELVPNYLPAVPRDPFSHEPLKYNPARGIIYSVGVNLKDDGGRPTAIPMSDATEPTVETGIGVARVGP